MKKVLIALLVILASNFALAQTSANHKIQHGFVLSDNDRFASHLVASGHHSWQVEISGELMISSMEEETFYLKRKLENSPIKKTYFVFQAQEIALSEIAVGQVFEGHIIESKVGDYEPKNIIVNSAKFIVKAIHLNIENPFFKD